MDNQMMRMSLAMLATLACLHLTPAVADQPLGKAAQNAIYAQTLVNEIVAQHPELVVVGMHAARPGSKQSTMIAANLDRIGKQDDEDDLAVAHERKTILAPNLKDPARFEVAVPLKDATGTVIGCLATVFKYSTGDDEVRMHAAAVAIRDELARKIANAAVLFKPAH